MAKHRGLTNAVSTGINRYRHDHFSEMDLPIVAFVVPFIIQIETSRVCNLRCLMCEYSTMENKGIVMNLEKFQAILKQFPKTSSIDITGIGEPFCNPDFLDIVSHAKSKGFEVKFVNNGNLLTEQRMDALIDMKVNQVAFSIDASTKQTHEKIRVHSKFDRVMDNIRLFSKKITQAGNNLPFIEMNYTLSQDNIEEASQFPALAQSVGVNFIAFRDMLFFDKSAYQENDSIESLGTERLEEIREEIITEGKRHGVDVELSKILSGNKPERMLCRKPWADLYIDVFGNVHPCCQVTQRTEDTSNYVMGNLFEETFDSIWNSEKYQKLREEMIHSTSIPAMCQGCDQLIKNNV